jgi:hypothetical protein
MDAAVSVLCANEMVAKAAPALCKRITLAMGSDSAVASAATPAVAPTAASAPTKAIGVTTGPTTGQVEKGSDGKSYRYNGQGWVPIADEARPIERITTSMK